MNTFISHPKHINTIKSYKIFKTVPDGLLDKGEEGNLTEFVEESLGLRRLKKLLRRPHFRDSTRVVFPDAEWPKSFSFILGCRLCVGLRC